MAKPQKAFTYREDIEIDRDTKTLYDWVSRIEVVTSNPDGSRVARYDGEVVKLEVGGNEYIEVARSAGSTVWRGVLLSDTP